MFPFPIFSPSHSIPATTIHIEGFMFVVTLLNLDSSLSSFTFRFVKSTFTKSGYTFPVSPRNLFSPYCSSCSLTSSIISNLSQLNLTNLGVLMIFLLNSNRYLSMLSSLSDSCILPNQPSKCPLVSMNLPELTVCSNFFFGLHEEGMATMYGDGFWSCF